MRLPAKALEELKRLTHASWNSNVPLPDGPAVLAAAAVVGDWSGMEPDDRVHVQIIIERISRCFRTCDASWAQEYGWPSLQHLGRALSACANAEAYVAELVHEVQQQDQVWQSSALFLGCMAVHLGSDHNKIATCVTQRAVDGLQDDDYDSDFMILLCYFGDESHADILRQDAARTFVPERCRSLAMAAAEKICSRLVLGAIVVDE